MLTIVVYIITHSACIQYTNDECYIDVDNMIQVFLFPRPRKLPLLERLLLLLELPSSRFSSSWFLHCDSTSASLVWASSSSSFLSFSSEDRVAWWSESGWSGCCCKSCVEAVVLLLCCMLHCACGILVK